MSKEMKTFVVGSITGGLVHPDTKEIIPTGESITLDANDEQTAYWLQEGVIEEIK